MQLTEMLATAEKETQRIKALEGDWLQQIQALNQAIAQVTEWQKVVFKVFGAPRYLDNNSHTKDMKPGDVLRLNPHDISEYEQYEAIAQEDMSGMGYYDGNGTVRYTGGHKKGEKYQTQRQTGSHRVYSFPSLGTIEAPAATIVQALYHDPYRQQVVYKAVLKTDENAFLAEMLPKTIVVSHDPDYTLFDITITVPREHLVKESLHILSEKIENYKPSVVPRSSHIRDRIHNFFFDRNGVRGRTMILFALLPPVVAFALVEFFR